jgi:hypothetical protein
MYRMADRYTQMTQLYVLFLQSKEITTTFYDYELQLRKIYMRRVYNSFNETYKLSTTFSISEDTSQNGYYFVEHRVVQTEFPWLQHAFNVKAVYNHQNFENSTFFYQCMIWEYTGNK